MTSTKHPPTPLMVTRQHANRVKQFGDDMRLESPEFDAMVAKQNPRAACQHRPGSPEKVAMLCARAAHHDALIPLWHPDDKVDHTAHMLIIPSAPRLPEYEDDDDDYLEDDL